VPSALPQTPLQMAENYLFDHRDDGFRLLLTLVAKRRDVALGARDFGFHMSSSGGAGDTRSNSSRSSGVLPHCRAPSAVVLPYI
jgi:hypothetical protein